MKLKIKQSVFPSLVVAFLVTLGVSVIMQLMYDLPSLGWAGAAALTKFAVISVIFIHFAGVVASTFGVYVMSKQLRKIWTV
jgi:hypothetical protein